MTKGWTSAALFFAAAGIAALGLGLFVYPVYPALVWTLLFLCWACYRLRMRAVAQFSSLAAGRSAAPASHWPDDEDESA